MILYVNLHSSRCGACNQNADPDETFHDNRDMRGEGCGRMFTHVSSDYSDFPGLHDRIRAMRPDLIDVLPEWRNPQVEQVPADT